MNKKNIKDLAIDIGADIVGSVIYAIGVSMFTEPNDIAPGGVTGISTVLHSITGIQIGTWAFIINIPIMLLGFFFLGKKVMISTFRSLTIMTLIMNYLDLVIPEYSDNPLLAAIFGGAAIGIGLGIIFLRGSTTGGTDIIGRIIIKWIPHIPFGKILLVIDAIIVIIAAFYYETLNAALYAFISIYITERAIDAVLYGSNEGLLAYVMSEKYESITKRVIVECDRGITLLDGKGGYSGKTKQVIVCAMPSRQFAQFKKIVYEEDPNAFIATSPTKHIIGEGFKQTFE